MLGVFEWVDESQTLRQFLEVEYKAKQGRLGGNLTDKNQGFINYMNYIRRICPGVNDRNSWYKTLLCKPKK